MNELVNETHHPKLTAYFNLFIVSNLVNLYCYLSLALESINVFIRLFV